MVLAYLMRGLDIVLGYLMREETERARAHRPFASARPKAPLRVLFAGDSLVVGVGASDPRKTVAGRFAGDFPDAHIDNLGRCGARVHHLREMLAGVEGEAYDLVVIQIGGNDVTHLTALAQLQSDLSVALSMAKRLSPRVVLMSYGDVGRSPRFWWPMTKLYSERSIEARDLFKRIARMHRVAFIDLLNRRYDPTLHPEKYIAADGLHVNDEGYRLFYRALKRRLRRLGISPRTSAARASGRFAWNG